MRRLVAWCGAAMLIAMMPAADAFAEGPLSCTSTDDPSATPTLEWATTAADPTHAGHLRTNGAPIAPSTCAAPGAAPPVLDAANDYHYDFFTFRNRTGAAACVTIDIFYLLANPSGGGVGPHEAAVYFGEFDPTDIRKNYLGDSGKNEGGPNRDLFSVNVPAASNFVLVVTWAGPVLPAYEPHYKMYITGCGTVGGGPGPDAGNVGDASTDGATTDGDVPDANGAGGGGTDGAPSTGNDDDGSASGSGSNDSGDGDASPPPAPGSPSDKGTGNDGTGSSGPTGIDGGGSASCSASGGLPSAATLTLCVLGLAAAARKRRRG